jgi:hypothetical protein
MNVQRHVNELMFDIFGSKIKHTHTQILIIIPCPVFVVVGLIEIYDDFLMNFSLETQKKLKKNKPKKRKKTTIFKQNKSEAF